LNFILKVKVRLLNFINIFYMGQKVHPLGFRVGITKKHQSQWFARFNKYKYSQSVLEDRMLRQTLTTLFPKLLNPFLKKVQKRDEDSLVTPRITQIKIERGLIPYEIGIQIHAENCHLIKSSIDNLKINRDLVCQLQKTRRYLQHLRFKLKDYTTLTNSLKTGVSSSQNSEKSEGLFYKNKSFYKRSLVGPLDPKPPGQINLGSKAPLTPSEAPPKPLGRRGGAWKKRQKGSLLFSKNSESLLKENLKEKKSVLGAGAPPPPWTKKKKQTAGLGGTADSFVHFLKNGYRKRPRLTKLQLRRQRLLFKRLKKRQLIRNRYKSPKLSYKGGFVFLSKKGNKVIQKLTRLVSSYGGTAAKLFSTKQQFLALPKGGSLASRLSFSKKMNPSSNPNNSLRSFLTISNNQTLPVGPLAPKPPGQISSPGGLGEQSSPNPQPLRGSPKGALFLKEAFLKEGGKAPRTGTQPPLGRTSERPAELKGTQKTGTLKNAFYKGLKTKKSAFGQKGSITKTGLLIRTAPSPKKYTSLSILKLRLKKKFISIFINRMNNKFLQSLKNSLLKIKSLLKASDLTISYKSFKKGHPDLRSEAPFSPSLPLPSSRGPHGPLRSREEQGWGGQRGGEEGGLPSFGSAGRGRTSKGLESQLGSNKKWNFTSKKTKKRLTSQSLSKLTKLKRVLEKKSLKKLESLRKDFIAFGSITKTASFNYYQMLMFLKHLKEHIAFIKRKQKLQLTIQKWNREGNTKLERSFWPLLEVSSQRLFQTKGNKESLFSKTRGVGPLPLNPGLGNPFVLPLPNQKGSLGGPVEGVIKRTQRVYKRMNSSNVDTKTITMNILSKKLNNIENECRKIKFIEYLKALVKKHRTENLYLYLPTIGEACKDLRQLQNFTKRHISFLFGLNRSNNLTSRNSSLSDKNTAGEGGEGERSSKGSEAPLTTSSAAHPEGVGFGGLRGGGLKGYILK
jgi:hypothetical protein